MIFDQTNVRLHLLFIMQKHPDVASSTPFLLLDKKKNMKLFPLLFLHEEAPDADNYAQWTSIPCIATEIEFPMKKWVHVGCEVFGFAISITTSYLTTYCTFCFMNCSGYP